jgi:cobyrinic acid a,c-diamide synthase
MRKFLIAATNSGCGKTTITIGLLRALQQKGLRVQPFKCGPDYIDTQYHRIAAGVESVNLDTWFASPEHLRNVFHHYGDEADVCVVEGVMGAYDGYDHDHGSSAEIAQILDIPMILIVNAKSMAYSVAPVLYGFKHFRGNMLAGVIFNNVGSERHVRLLRDACEDVGVKCFGMIPRLSDLTIPSRHLGLSLENEQMIQTLVEKAANAVNRYVDVEAIVGGETFFRGERREEREERNVLSASEQVKGFVTSEQDTRIGSGVLAEEYSLFSLPSPLSSKSLSSKTISIACDEAFNFTYRENIDALRMCGKVTFFSPLRDKRIPEGTDFLYLPGGYPEFFLKELTANAEMRQSVHDYIEGNGKTLAECGGMMYLCKQIIDAEGIAHPMCGILKQEATLQDMHLHLGYREMMLNGQTWRGHEFHYSEVRGCEGAGARGHENANVCDAAGRPTETPFYIYKNLRASYLHLYWGNRNILSLFE